MPADHADLTSLKENQFSSPIAAKLLPAADHLIKTSPRAGHLRAQSPFLTSPSPAELIKHAHLHHPLSPLPAASNAHVAQTVGRSRKPEQSAPHSITAASPNSPFGVPSFSSAEESSSFDPLCSDTSIKRSLRSSGGPLRSRQPIVEQVPFPASSLGVITLCKTVPSSTLLASASAPVVSVAGSTDRLAQLHTHLRTACHTASYIISRRDHYLAEGFFFSASSTESSPVVHHTCESSALQAKLRRVSSCDSSAEMHKHQRGGCGCKRFAVPVPTHIDPEDVVLAADHQAALGNIDHRWRANQSAFALMLTVPSPIIVPMTPPMSASSSLGSPCGAQAFPQQNVERTFLYMFSLVPETGQWMVLLI
ncbi:hypothetical protein BJ742DRAFT_359710 [Cladochytrium replicatum]|nr:hypothetical protein BJ742DRAFT_359710 [Cladochytrium replicatum]